MFFKAIIPFLTLVALHTNWISAFPVEDLDTRTGDLDVRSSGGGGGGGNWGGSYAGAPAFPLGNIPIPARQVILYQNLYGIVVERQSSRNWQWGALSNYAQFITNLEVPWNLALQFGTGQPILNQQVRTQWTVEYTGRFNVGAFNGPQSTFNVRIALRSTRANDLWSAILGHMGGQNELLTILNNALTYAINHNYEFSTWNIGLPNGIPNLNNPGQAGFYLLVAQFDVQITWTNH